MIVPESYIVVFNKNDKVEIVEKQLFKEEKYSYVQLNYLSFCFDSENRAIEWVSKNVKSKYLNSASEYYEDIIKLKKQIKKSKKVLKNRFLKKD